MDDLLQWAQSGVVSSGVGTGEGDLTRLAQVALPTLIDPRTKPSRSRPNRGRKKRTNRSPLAEPPWDILEATGYAIPPDITCIPNTPVNWRRGPNYTRWRAEVHAMWGHDCHLCGHPGANTADHLVPLSLWSNQPYDARLSRPAHGIDACDTCHVKCNTSRSNKALARQIATYQPPVTL